MVSEDRHHNAAIDEIRETIDRIDGQILDLLNRRAEAALRIGKVKKEGNLPVYAPDREKAVLERLVRENRGPLPAEAIEDIFQAIIRQVRGFEEAKNEE